MQTALRRHAAVIIAAVAAFGIGLIVRGVFVSQAATLTAPAPEAQVLHVGDVFANGAFTAMSGRPGIRGHVIAQTKTGSVVLLKMTSVKKHYHKTYDHFGYVVAGSGKLWLGNSAVDVKAGDLLVIPALTPHALQAAGGALEVLNFNSPPAAAADIVWVK